MALAEIRLNRTEQDIETLRSTQSALMERIASFAGTLEEGLDIVRDNQKRLDGIDTRLDGIDTRLDSIEARLNQLEEVVLENRVILLAIADHLDLTLEKPS